MSISTYSDVLTGVANWLHRDDLTDYIPDLIRFGELRIYRDLRIRAMEAALSETIASGAIAIPSAYVALKFAYINATPVGKLERKDAEWLYLNYPTRSADSKPKYIAREADNFIFGPYPDSAYTVKGIYYQRLEALSDSNSTNWFTANAPDLLLFAALCESGIFTEDDPRLNVWEKKYEMLKRAVQADDDNEEFSGSPLAATVR